MTVTTSSPEIGKSLRVGDITVNYLDQGQGETVLLIHGSGPGVSAWANWRGVIPELSSAYRVLAPDMAGFGRTEVAPGHQYNLQTWVAQIIGLLDALGVDRVSVIGNSFGGALALHLARAHPGRVHKIVLMGAVSLPFTLTEGLDTVWGYTPSLEGMRKLMGVFAWNQSLITDELIQSRYEVSMQRGMDKVYESLFPAPRQRWVDMLAQSPEELAKVVQPTLIVHGRDDQVIPLEVSVRLLDVMPNADLLVFGNCGHWTQIEKREAFVQAVRGFLPDGTAA